MNSKGRYPSLTELFRRNRNNEIPESAILKNVTTHVKLEDFQVISKIGKGGFSTVFLVKKHNTFFALKILSKLHLQQSNQIKGAMNEKKVMQSLSSNFIVKMHATMNEPESGWIGMVIDYAGGMDLYFWLRRCKTFDESWVKFYSGQIILALEYLHSNRIIYRDIKPENIMVDLNGYVRLSDFGFSRQIVTEIQRVDTFCGSPEYIAPEILKGVPYTYKADLWSLGILIHELAVGKTPFTGHDIETVYSNIQNNRVKFGVVTQECSSLLRRLLEVEKKRMGTCAEVKMDQWFIDMQWEELEARRLEPPFVPYLMPIEQKQDDLDEMQRMITQFNGNIHKLTASSFDDF